jgi:hypothetical protein
MTGRMATEVSTVSVVNAAHTLQRSAGLAGAVASALSQQPRTAPLVRPEVNDRWVPGSPPVMRGRDRRGQGKGSS